MKNLTLITGSSSGIGKTFAYEFAKDIIDVILTSRNQLKLEKLTKDLEQEFHIKAYCIPIDLSKPKSA